MDSVRVDKWLWAARFYKTRQLAVEAVNGGHVHLNGQRTKAARRTEREIFKNDAFDRLRAECAENGTDFTDVTARVTTVAGDVTVNGFPPISNG